MAATRSSDRHLGRAAMNTARTANPAAIEEPWLIRHLATASHIGRRQRSRSPRGVRAQVPSASPRIPDERECSGCLSCSGGVEQAADEEADRGGAEPDGDHLKPVLPRRPGGARRLAVARLPRKTAPTAAPATTVPARNRATWAWARAATVRPRPARNRPRPASTTRRLLTRKGRARDRGVSAAGKREDAPGALLDQRERPGGADRVGAGAGRGARPAAVLAVRARRTAGHRGRVEAGPTPDGGSRSGRLGGRRAAADRSGRAGGPGSGW